MKKSNNKVSLHKQKRYSKNKARLKGKPQLSKQQRKELRMRDLLTQQIYINNMQLAQKELANDK